MRKRILATLILISMLTYSPAIYAEEIVKKLLYDIQLETGTIHVNMDTPVVPTVMYQYKVKPVTMDMKAVKAIILAHAQPPTKGDQWAFSNNNSRKMDRLLCMKRSKVGMR